MRITDIRRTTVTVPPRSAAAPRQRLPLGAVRPHDRRGRDRRRASSASAKWAAAASRPRRVFRALKTYLVGHDPARLEEMRFLIANPTASLYNNRTQMLAALEFACLDILGQKWGVPVCDILGGRLRDRVPFASYLFFRYPNEGRRAARCARSTSSSRTRAI